MTALDNPHPPLNDDKKPISRVKTTFSGHLNAKKNSTDNKTKMMCKFCLSDECSANLGTQETSPKNGKRQKKPKDPKDVQNLDHDKVLITPCNCKGSMSTVHLGCIKLWIKSKMVKEGSNIQRFHWKSLECELCKEQLPKSINIFGKDHDLFQIDLPDEDPYIILEAKEFIDKKKSSVYYLIYFPTNTDGEREQQISFGRTSECDVKLSDISVSRTHAFLKRRNSDLFLIDNKAKFGTLLRMRKGLDLFQACQGMSKPVEI